MKQTHIAIVPMSQFVQISISILVVRFQKSYKVVTYDLSGPNIAEKLRSLCQVVEKTGRSKVNFIKIVDRRRVSIVATNYVALSLTQHTAIPQMPPTRRRLPLLLSTQYSYLLIYE